MVDVPQENPSSSRMPEESTTADIAHRKINLQKKLETEEIEEIRNNPINLDKEDGISDDEDSNNEFECNICFDSPTQPIVTPCGHLYCWPCIYRWIHSGRSVTACPVCKAEVKTENIIPVYGRGGNNKDPRTTVPEEQESVPPRPTPQRTEAQMPQPQFNPFGFNHAQQFRGGGITFSAGIGPGLFPFQVNAGNQQGPLTPQQQQEMQRSRLLLLLAFIVLSTTIFLS